MKHLFVLLLLCLFLIPAGILTPLEAQNARTKVLQATSTDNLIELAEAWKTQSVIEKNQAAQKAKELGLPLRMELENGSIYELDRFDGAFPVYNITTNLVAARSTSTDKVHKGGSSGYELSGAGMIIGEWDGGAVRLSHQEFQGRVIQRDGAGTISNHATHVAGTLVGAGVRADAIGMAPEATLWAHDWNSDNSEMAAAAAQGLLVSNHSYGNITGWARGEWAEAGVTEWHWWGDVNISEEEDYRFGYYDNKTAQWDQISFNAPYYLIVKSAGNDRSNEGAINHKVLINGSWESSTTPRPRDGGINGYDCLPTYSNSKNILTIGAVGDLANGYNGPGSVNMSSFSGWGPTDDGRIKPDLVGNGVGLNSSTSDGDDTYGSLSGTSMSGPNVAGSLILLQEMHDRTFGSFMRSATLKGLAIQTADEAGTTPGPDYRFGWGLLNTLTAAVTIDQAGIHTSIIESKLNQGESYTTSLFSNGIDPVKLTLCWTDPEGTAGPVSLNNRTPKLVNDLDLRLISVEDPDLVYFPYTLDPDNPAAAANQEDNIRDNVEQVDAGVIPAGEYIVQVTHKNQLRFGAQDFSLIIGAPAFECILGIAQDINFVLPCGVDAIEVLEVPAPDPDGSFEYALDGESFQESPVFENLSIGKYRITIRDDQGCIGLQRVSVDPAVSITSELVDRDFFNILGEHSNINLTYNSAFSSNWGGNPAVDAFVVEAILAQDDTANPTLGCGNITNASEMEGKIVFFDRGGCEFGAKALKAQNAGASAVVIMNNENSLMLMGAGAQGVNVTIPVFMITSSSGDQIRPLLQGEGFEMQIGRMLALESATCAGNFDGAIRPAIQGGEGPYTYEWSSGQTELYTEGLDPGMYVLSVTDAQGCIEIFEYEVPAAPEPDLQIITQGESCLDESNGQILIPDFLTLIDTYDLFIEGMPIPSDLLSGLPGDTYEISLTNRNNSCTYNYTVEIPSGASLEEPVINGAASAFPGVEYSFTVEEIDQARYVWTVEGGSIIQGQNTAQILAVFDDELETYELSVEITLENCSKSNSIAINKETSSVNSGTIDQKIEIFPNPAQDELRIRVSGGKATDQANIQIIDWQGKVVLSSTIMGAETLLDISRLIPGVYIIRHISGQHSSSHKIIKY